MDYRNSLFSRRCGYLLVECLIVILLLVTAAGAAMPRFWDWQEEQELDMAANEVAGAIRQAEVLVKSKDRVSDMDELSFRCAKGSDGRISYSTIRSARTIHPRGKLSANITATGDMWLRLRKDGFTGNSERYQIHLYTKDKKYVRSVIVEMYTGRVRITDTVE